MSDKVKLSDIVIDPTIQVREVEAYTVSEYAASMRAGSQFPPLILEKDSNRLVCGNHRYFAYKRVMEPSDEVPCEFRKFSDEAEIIRTAAKDNATHGRPLDTWDRKRITLRLQEFGDSLEGIAALLNVPVSKVETWAGLHVVVIGKKGKTKLRHKEPIKRGLAHMAGKEVTEEDYREHAQQDRGVPAAQQARQLIGWIEKGWISEDQATQQAITDLYNSLIHYFKNREKTA